MCTAVPGRKVNKAKPGHHCVCLHPSQKLQYILLVNKGAAPVCLNFALNNILILCVNFYRDHSSMDAKITDY